MAQKRKKKTASKKRRATGKPGKRRASKSTKRRASKKRARREYVEMNASAKAICSAFPRECIAAGKKHAAALKTYGHTTGRFFSTTQRVGKTLLRFTTDKVRHQTRVWY